jgi:hypothetical protein
VKSYEAGCMTKCGVTCVGIPGPLFGPITKCVSETVMRLILTKDHRYVGVQTSSYPLLLLPQRAVRPALPNMLLRLLSVTVSGTVPGRRSLTRDVRLS